MRFISFDLQWIVECFSDIMQSYEVSNSFFEGSKRMKKIIAVCLLVMMTITAAACSNTGTDSSGLPNENSTPPASSAASGQLIVGSVTDLNSDFMSGWTSGRANADAMRLIYGYSPVVYSKEGTFVVDPTVVKDGGIEVQENEDGSKTYTISLQDSDRKSVV